jgi:poly-gamma-glutamate capsule biosynthesis protein CapA/YwtB (metallophosphatase superfamily)
MAEAVRLFLAGDVMTGRGVDQIQVQASAPDLHEPFVRDARAYVSLADEVSGAVPRAVNPAYIWGDALHEWARKMPAARIVNLETSVTRSDEYDRTKSIHYRMHPSNIACLTSAGFDVCVLANNHVLDYGRPGLIETLDALAAAGCVTVGAGRTAAEARRCAVRTLPGGTRLIVSAWGHGSSGVPDNWAALADEPGVNLLPDFSIETATLVASYATQARSARTIAVVSIHWGDNWGYEVPRAWTDFAHHLIDRGVDVVYGHSSHHPRPIEVYRERLVLYGCGDFLDDYEGISGYERYRDDLVLMYFPSLDAATGRLLRLEMTPLQIRRLRLNRISEPDARWMRDTLDRISSPFGVRVELTPERTLALVLPAATGAERPPA